MMELSGLLMRRVMQVTAPCLALALLAALWQAQRNVQGEAEGAARAAELVSHLASLADGTPAAAATHLKALRRLNDSGELRHLQLRLADGEGRELVAPAALAAPASALARLPWWQPPSAAPLSRSWEIQLADGTRWHASLLWSPLGEQREALADIIGLLVVLLAFGAMVLAGIGWAVRRALAPLRDILCAIVAYERHDYRHRLPAMPTRELDIIARALDQLAGALERTEAAQRALSLRVLTLQEQERARLARELHDEFGQVLTAMRADTAYLMRKTRADPALAAVAQDLANHCERIQLEVRDLLHRLRPHGLLPGSGPVPLERMLRDLVQGWRDQPGLHAEFLLHLDLRAERLPDTLAVSLYRMTQEALTNTVRHAHASRVAVTLQSSANGEVLWMVEDDGVGIAAPVASDMAGQSDLDQHTGNGLCGIRERAWAHGGAFEIGAVRPGTDRPGLRIAVQFGQPHGAPAEREEATEAGRVW
ncbi:histidine kinase [Cupriavidus necator]